MNPFASLNDVMAIAGKTYSAAEQARIETLLPLVSDALRVDAFRYSWDLDEHATGSETYANLLKLVTADVVSRAMRQSADGEPMQQETQSALGYSWSGSYAIPGGGVAGAIMNNDRRRLGYMRQRFGVIEFYDDQGN